MSAAGGNARRGAWLVAAGTLGAPTPRYGMTESAAGTGRSLESRFRSLSR